jgi:hypothetical protein
VRPLLGLIIDVFPRPPSAACAADRCRRRRGGGHPDHGRAIPVFKTFSDLRRQDLGVPRAAGHHRLRWRWSTPPRASTAPAASLVGKQFPVDQLGTGGIGGVAKLKDPHRPTLVGGSGKVTLRSRCRPSRPQSGRGFNASSKDDEAKLAIGLGKLREEDPRSRSVEPRTHKTVLAGTVSPGRHLAKLKNRFPSIQQSSRCPYRETITGSAQGQGRHKKQTGGHGRSATSG